MESISYEAFNRGFYARMSRYDKWEKAEFDTFEAFFSNEKPLTPDTKNQLPQFAFNVVKGRREISIQYPVDFLVTEIDLPKTIRKKLKNDVDLAQHWRWQFKTWYRKIRSNANIPYWMFYITSSGYGLRFILHVENQINDEAEYKAACRQFLESLEQYGITSDYHDLNIVRRGWYFPTDKRYCNIRGDIFSPDLTRINRNNVGNNRVMAQIDESKSHESVNKVIAQIEEKGTDITTNYNDWVLIGFAFAHAFGEEGRAYFHRVSQLHPEYDEVKCNKKYDSCLRSKGSGITLGTFFHFARERGIQIPTEINVEDERFWYFENQRLRIDYDAYFKMLHSKGIGRLARKYTDDVVFIRVDRKNKTVKQISRNEISGFTTRLIEGFNVEATLRKQISNAFLGDSKILMPKNYAAIRPIQIEFLRDTTDTAFFFFQNCFVEVTVNAITPHHYSDMNGYIWASQMIPREFDKVPAKNIRTK